MHQNLLWNNVCLLGRIEEQFINTLEFEHTQTEYYGLGRKMDLQTYFKSSEDNWGCTISTDTELYQDKQFFPGKEKHLRKIAWTDIPKLPSSTLYDNPHYQPFIVIPLVMVVNQNYTDLRPSSLKDLCSPKYKGLVTFGGLHNSAGKSLLKAVWSLYGKEAAIQLLENSFPASMPAAAFKCVASGQYPIAIVPTIFAAREGLSGLKAYVPKEGAVAIPSYVAFHKECPEETMTEIKEQLVQNKVFHQQLFQNGQIVTPFNPDSWMALYYPPQSFFDQLNHNEFNTLVQKYLRK